MNYFRKLTIENFQSHVYTEIEFSAGLNVLVGPSDSGKSATLRALRWVLFNIPRGGDFIRTGSKECKVTILFSDGTKVIRVRSSAVNRYVMQTAVGEEQIFEAFGNTIPQEITNMHGIQMIKLDLKEFLLNFSNQLESPFLLFESPANKAKMIGRISGAHIIDQALKKTGQDRATIRTAIKQMEQHREELIIKSEPYKVLPRLEQELAHVEEMYENTQRKNNKLTRLSELAKRWDIFTIEHERVASTIERLRLVPRAGQMLSNIELKSSMLYRLQRIYSSLQQVSTAYKICLQQVAIKDKMPQLDHLSQSLAAKQYRLGQIKLIHRHWVENQEKIVKTRKVLVNTDSFKLCVEKIAKNETRFDKLKQLQIHAIIWKKFYLQKNEAIKTRDRFQPSIKSIQNFDMMGTKIDNYKKFCELASNFTEVRKRIYLGKNFYEEKNNEIKLLEDVWSKLIGECERCPTCGEPMKSG